MESGQWKKIKARYDKGMHCDAMSADDGTPLSYQKLFLLIVIMLGGIILAILTLGYEMLKSRSQTWCHSNKVTQEKGALLDAKSASTFPRDTKTTTSSHNGSNSEAQMTQIESV